MSGSEMRVDIFAVTAMGELFGAGDQEEWREGAICAQTDPEAFFPEKGGTVEEAKSVCQVCPVQSECLAYALAHDERYGVWGGKSVREREKIKDRSAR